MTQLSISYPLNATRLKGIGVLRIVFGLAWAVIAWLKWQPDFLNNFTGYLTGAVDGQPPAVAAWLHLWINIVNVNPQLFAYLVAFAETVIALGLIFGVFSNFTNSLGILLTLVIWSTAEGFGGPYGPGATDIGGAIFASFGFAILFLSNAGLVMGLDQWLSPKLGRLAFLASGSSSRT